MTPEQKKAILTKIANEHSYDTWDELVYDSHRDTIIHHTLEAMDEVEKQRDEEVERLKKLVTELTEQDFKTIDTLKKQVERQRELLEEIYRTFSGNDTQVVQLLPTNDSFYTPDWVKKLATYIDKL